MPLGEGLPDQSVDGGPILPDQLQPLPHALRRKVDPAEEDARHEMTDLIRDRFIGDGFQRPLGGGRTVGVGPRVVDFGLHFGNRHLQRRVGHASLPPAPSSGSPSTSRPPPALLDNHPPRQQCGSASSPLFCSAWPLRLHTRKSPSSILARAQATTTLSRPCSRRIKRSSMHASPNSSSAGARTSITGSIPA